MAGNAFTKETGLHYIDSTGSVLGTETTVMVTTVVFVAVTSGDDLKLTDGNDKLFVEVKGSANLPVVLPFEKPRKLTGLKCATIDGSSICYLYVDQK